MQLLLLQKQGKKLLYLVNKMHSNQIFVTFIDLMRSCYPEMMCCIAIFVELFQILQKYQEKWQVSLLLTLLLFALGKTKGNYQLVRYAPLNRRKVPELFNWRGPSVIVMSISMQIRTIMFHYLTLKEIVIRRCLIKIAWRLNNFFHSSEVHGRVIKT